MEFYLLRKRWGNRLNPWSRRKTRLLSQMNSVRLHWGCGSRILDGWVNIDGFPAPGIDFTMDLRGRLPFRDNSVQFIFTEHVLEHISHAAGRKVLAEFYRVLQPGGVARIIVPDLKSFCESYLNSDQEFFEKVGVAGPNTADGMNSLFYGHFHRYIYDFDALRASLEKGGFEHVEHSSHLGSSHPELLLDTDSVERELASLYVEARK